MRRLKNHMKKNQLRDKLRNQRGASLLFAFLFLLVASMVSAVIIAGATTATRRVHEDWDREQNYLTLESGAKLLRDMLADTTITITVTEETDPETGETLPPNYENTGSSVLSDMIGKAVQKLYQDDSDESVEKVTAVVTFKNNSEEQVFQDIQMDFTIKKDIDDETGQADYTASGVIKMKDADDSDPRQQRLFFKADFQNNTNQLTLDLSKMELYTRQRKEDTEKES